MKTTMIALFLMSMILTACASGPDYQNDEELRRMHEMHEQLFDFGRHGRN